MCLVAIRTASVSALSHLHDLRPDQQIAPVHAVGDHAAEERKKKDGDIAEECVEAQQKGRIA